MPRRFNLPAALLLALSGLTRVFQHQHASAGNLQNPDSLAAQVVIERGLCLLVEETDAGRIAGLADSTSLTIVVQCVDMEHVRQLQAALDEKRLLGTRVYVSQIENGRLCLASNLASVVVAAGSDIPRSELIRVLRPRGRLVVDGQWQQDPYNDWTESNPFGDLNSVLEVR